MLKSKYLLLISFLIPNIAFSQIVYINEVDTYEYEMPIHTYSEKNVNDKTKYTKIREEGAQAESWEEAYANFKKSLQEDFGLSYSLTSSILGQRGTPHGKGTAIQFQLYPTISWQAYNGEYGTGTLNVAYNPTRYWNSTSGEDLSNNINVVSAINDSTTKGNTFSDLNFTHQFSGSLNWLAITVGQFGLSAFDGTSYDSNQQVNFLNYALSQNATSSYPTASLGTYLTFTLNPEWQIIAGMQDANNINGTSISSSDFGKGDYTSFASLSYTPTFKNLGSGEYSILVFNQPSVEEQRGTSNGFSINAEQVLNDTYAIFGRISAVKNSPEEINQTYVIGGIMNNPFKRNQLDQIGLAASLNKVNKDVVGSQARNYETVFETYWAVGVGNWLTITPDFQFYIHPALDQSQNFATVSSIRTTFMF